MLEAVQASDLLDIVEQESIKAARGDFAATSAISVHIVCATKIRSLESPLTWVSNGADV